MEHRFQRQLPDVNALPNELPENQNTPRQLERLAAQRQLFTEAKRVQLAQALLTMVLMGAVSALAVVHRESEARAALLGIAISFIDVLALDPYQNKLREAAAKIRGAFDRETFGFTSVDLLDGADAPPETVSSAATRYRRNRSLDELRDWYPPELEVLELPLARLICQRSNMHWDSQLRARYITLLAVGLGGLVLLWFVVGLGLDLDLRSFVLAVLVPLSPAALWFGREILRHIEAMGYSRRIQQRLEQLVNDAAAKRRGVRDLDQQTRSIQQELLAFRQSAPLVPDWFYHLTRRSQEEAMQGGVAELIERIKGTAYR